MEMTEDKPLDVIESNIVYENPWIKIQEDKIARRNGDSGIYAYMDVKESVCIVAVDENEKICIVESYRHPFKEWYWELPGGGGEGEDIISASKKELEEETGIRAQNWKILGKARVCNGLSTERQTNVVATSLEFSEFIQKEDETRARRFVSLQELDAMIKKGEFADNQSITALYMYKIFLQS